MQKVNEIWLPEEDVQLSTEGLKQWIQFCKSQYKKFKCVLDCNAEYGIWSRSMRNYAKRIIAFETRKNFVKVCEKNTGPYNNIDFRRQAVQDSIQHPDKFTIDYFNYTDVDFIKVHSANAMKVFSGAPKTLTQNDENQSNVKFIYVEQINNDIDKFLTELKFKIIMDNKPDRVYYK